MAIGTGGTLGSNAYTSTAYAPLASPTFTGTVTIPTPFTIGAVSTTATGTQLNYLNAATGTTGTTSTNIVFSANPTFTGTLAAATVTATGVVSTGGYTTNATAGNGNIYVTGGIVANRLTTAAYLPLSAAGLGLRVGVNGSTAYTMTPSDAFGVFVIGTTGGVTEASSGTHPLVASQIIRQLTITNGSGATDIVSGLYIEGPPTGITPVTATYGLWLDAGTARLDGGILGTATNDNATAGNVGEYVSSLIAVGSAVSFTTATGAIVTSISLTAGDWDVDGNINYVATSATVTATVGGVTSTSATIPTDGSEVNSGVIGVVITETDGVTLPRKRFSLSGTTTVYLVAKATFSAGTVTAYGAITARRIR